MTPDITQFFEGKEIRAIDHKHEVWIPIADIASAWQIDRSTPDRIIERNERSFSGLVDTVLDAASTPMKCLNERGLYLLMGKISIARVKNGEAKEAIIRFQQWFPKLIQQYRKGEIQQRSEVDNPMLDCLNKYADMKDALIKRYDFDPLVARKLAMEAAIAEQPGLIVFKGPTLLPVGPESSTPQLPAASEIPQDHDFEAMFTLTQIADFCKTNRNVVLKILEDEGIIYHSASHVWALTKKGEQYGKMFPRKIVVPGRTTEEMFAKYRPEARDLVLDKLKGEQATLGEGK